MRRLLTPLAIVLGWVLLTASPASAHASLIGSTPSFGAHVSAPPTEVVLRFSEPVSVVPGAIRLLDGGGRAVSQDEARVVADHADQVRLPVPASLADGHYVVAWRVVSLDSHPIGGSFAFTVGNPSAPAPAAVPVAPAPSPPGSVGVAYWLVRGLGFAALAVMAGGMLFVLWCWPAGRTDSRLRTVVTAGWAASVVSALGGFALQGPYSAAAPLSRLFSPELLGTTLQSNYGQLVVARLALLAIAAPLLLSSLRPSAPRPPWLPLVAGGVVGLLPLTWAASGHARTAPLAIASDTAHLLAMAVWLGGLVVLFACVLRTRTRKGIAEATEVLPRFSRMAQVAVAVLILTGAFQAWRELRALPLDSGSAYPRILVFKVAAFGLLLTLGAASRALVQHRYVRPVAHAFAASTVVGRAGAPVTKAGARPHQPGVRLGQEALRLLRRSVGLEVTIAAGVLALTAALVSTSPTPTPGSEAPAGYQGPFNAVLTLPDGGNVDVWIDPARPGSNEIILNVRGRDGVNRDVPAVSALLGNAAFDAEPMPVAFTNTAPGQFAARNVLIAGAGSWTLELHIRTSDVDEVPLSTVVPVS